MSGAFDWNKVIPSVASTYCAELHLVCGDAVVFFCPVRHVGCVWRPSHQLAQITGPLTAAEFVRAVLARGVAMPTGAAMLTWSAAITCGQLVTASPFELAAFADAIDGASQESGAGQAASKATRH